MRLALHAAVRLDVVKSMAWRTRPEDVGPAFGFRKSKRGFEERTYDVVQSVGIVLEDSGHYPASGQGYEIPKLLSGHGQTSRNDELPAARGDDGRDMRSSGRSLDDGRYSVHPGSRLVKIVFENLDENQGSSWPSGDSGTEPPASDSGRADEVRLRSCHRRSLSQRERGLEPMRSSKTHWSAAISG